MEPKKPRRVPKYRLHEATGQAYVEHQCICPQFNSSFYAKSIRLSPYVCVNPPSV